MVPIERISAACRQRKRELGVTYRQIAETSGVLLDTVHDFMLKPRKSPSIHTVGPICGVLGVSLDALYFTPCPEGKHKTRKENHSCSI